MSDVEVVNSKEVPMISSVVSRELPKVRGRQYETLHDRTCTINAHWGTLRVSYLEPSVGFVSANTVLHKRRK